MSIQREENGRLFSAESTVRGTYSGVSGFNDDRSESERKMFESDETGLISGDYIKSIIFGGIDGILTSVAVTFGATGGNFAANVILGLGCSIVTANALHLGIGEYLSSKAHRDFVQTEKRREQWKFKNFKEDQIKEMINVFEERGMARQDAEVVVRKMSAYDAFFVNMAVTEELGLQVPDEDDALLLKDSFVMFFSFAIFGSLPLLSYGLEPFNILHLDDMFYVSVAVSAVALFLLGCIKSTFSSAFWLFTGSETLILGAVCACLAYGVGLGMRVLLDY